MNIQKDKITAQSKIDGLADAINNAVIDTPTTTPTFKVTGTSYISMESSTKITSYKICDLETGDKSFEFDSGLVTKERLQSFVHKLEVARIAFKM